jgi:very-short-patch-repair endonuclease
MMKRPMFYGAKAHIFEKAKHLRENMTEAESILWDFLRKNKVMGYRFKPQHPIDIFIADFYCHKLRLVIEVDGEMHKNEKNIRYDHSRTEELKQLGIKVIRVMNDEVLNTLPQTKQEIIKACNDRKKELEGD